MQIDLDSDLRHEMIDTLLINQKNELLARINKATELKDDHFEVVRSIGEIEEVLMLLQFIAPLWFAASYGYKVKEIVYRIGHVLANTKSTLHHRQLSLLNKIQSCLAICDKLEKS